MRSETEHDELTNGSDYRELKLLSEVHKSSSVSQRDLSRRLGIALGLTNALLRNLTQKGYVRVTRAGWRRWLYTLTPSGFSRKVQLTVAYVHRFLDHYRVVRQTLVQELERLGLHEESRVAIYGTGELAELVFLGLKELGIEEIEVFAPRPASGDKFLAMPVRDVTALISDHYDCVVVASLKDPEPRNAELSQLGIARGKVVNFFTDGRVREKV